MTANSDQPHIALVVEGPGDLRAVPLLLRRHLERAGIFSDILGKPVPFHGKGNATALGGIEGYVATAARPGCVGIIVVLDADKEKICEEGPALLQRAQAQVGVPVVIAIAERDFEDWLYASAETLFESPMQYEPARRGKSAIPEAMAPAKYVKPTHQPRLTARMDLGLAESRSASLRRLFNKFDLLRADLT